jgi:hypothetical protein
MPNVVNNQLDPLTVKHRMERLSKDYNLKLNADYFAVIHNRSKSRINAALGGRAKNLLARINRHLDVVEERCKRRNEA